jgi:uncharacterized integral membrane protein
MTIIRQLFGWLVVLPIAVVVVALGVANRASVTVAWNPLDPAAGAFQVPLFVIALAMFVLGALVGGFTVWNRQRHWRRAARDGRAEARTLKAEVDRLKQNVAPALAGPR